ncbi:hypothetical protein [Pleurocapsa sp. PCC 7319]|nr:hypothetical protein [Pleurocapsa sp. PCC 7319]
MNDYVVAQRHNPIIQRFHDLAPRGDRANRLRQRGKHSMAILGALM